MIKFNNLQAALELFAEEFINTYQDELINADANASGDLFNTLESNIIINDAEYKVELRIHEYWKYIEYGRAPGRFPPPNAILDWIRIKPVIPHEINGKIPTEQQLAFLIGRKIARDGIKPRPLMENTKSAVISKYEHVIMDALAEDIYAHVSRGLNEIF